MRIGIISTRHGTTPPPLYEKMLTQYFDLDDFRESLIQFAWIQVHPNVLMPEIKKTMNRLGIPLSSFFFKVLSPVFPPN